MLTVQPIPLDHFPEPVDYERELASMEVPERPASADLQAAIASDPMKDILVFPSDDWEIIVRPVFFVVNF